MRARHDYAVQLLSRALALRPGFAEAHQDLGNVLRVLGRLDEAAENYRAAIALKPDFAQAHCNLAAILIERGAHEVALEPATRAAELLPELAEAHLNRGAALSGRRRFAEAEAAYRRVLTLQPQNADALSNLGYVLIEMKQIDEALACHREALALQPDNPAFHLRRSAAQLLGGDPEASEASCRRALSLDPIPPPPRRVSSRWKVLSRHIQGEEIRARSVRIFSRFASQPKPLLGSKYSLTAVFTITAKGTGQDNSTINVSVVPEPASLALLGTALVGLGAFGRCRKQG